MFKNGKKFRNDVTTALQMNIILFKITSAGRKPDWNRW